VEKTIHHEEVFLYLYTQLNPKVFLKELIFVYRVKQFKEKDACLSCKNTP